MMITERAVPSTLAVALESRLSRYARSLTFIIGATFLVMSTNYTPFATDVELLTTSFPLEMPLTVLSVPGIFLSYIIILQKIFAKSLVRDILRANFFIVLLYVWSVISVLYSQHPSYAGLKLLYTLNFTAVSVGLYISSGNFSIFVKNLFYILFVLLILSFLGVALIPDRAIHISGSEDLVGLWRGVFWHKNTAGSAFTFLFLLSVNRAAGKSAGALGLSILAATLAIVFIIMAKDKTSIAVLLLTYPMILMARRIPLKANFLRTLLSAGVAGGLMIFAPVAVFFLERSFDITFTGRTSIWRAELAYWAQSPLLGYGFGMVHIPNGGISAFWGGWESMMQQAHNGYLGILGDLGAVGELIFFIYMVQTLKNAFLLAKISRDPTVTLLVAMVFISLIGVETEAFLMGPRLIWGICLLAMVNVNWLAAIHRVAGPASAARPQARPAAQSRGAKSLATIAEPSGDKC